MGIAPCRCKVCDLRGRPWRHLYALTPNEVQVAFYVRGRAAKEMFDAMGPGRKSECGIEKGGRVREKEHVACSYRPSDGYQCDFGFDLRSGRSIGGSIC